MLTIDEFKLAWNSQAVLTPAEKFRQQLFKEFGAYTRQTAKNSMVTMWVSKKLPIDKLREAEKRRDRKVNKLGFMLGLDGEKVSKPGNPAFSKVGFVKEHIYFAADKDECVIGPGLLNGTKSHGAMDVLEHGGIEQIVIGKTRRITITANYQARPTMGLAFKKAIDKKLQKLLDGGIMRAA